MVQPAWLDQIQGVDFEPEKKMLGDIQRWATDNGWVASDGSKLQFGLAAHTDVLLEKSHEDRRVRLAVLRKSNSGDGEIRLDSSEFTTIELIYLPDTKRWRAEVGNVTLQKDFNYEDIPWLFGKLFGE